MSTEFIETKDGVKVRKLVELKTSTAEEYQNAMLGRVEEFKQKNQQKSQFNSILQNTFFNTFGAILNLKVNIDKTLGEENIKKLNDFIDSILLFGL